MRQRRAARRKRLWRPPGPGTGSMMRALRICLRPSVSARLQRGAALPELAAAAILLCVLVLGLVDLGRAVQQYAALAASARASARYLATHSGSAEALDRARCLAISGRATGSCPESPSALRVVPGLAVQHVVISLPYAIVDDSGNSVIVAAAGLASIQARAATGENIGTVDLVTVTISPAAQPVYFEPLLPGLVPRLPLGPVSASAPVVAN